MSQSDRLLSLLRGGSWVRTDEILAKVYGDDHLGIARIGARIADLKARGAVIQGRRDKFKPTLYWYKMSKTPVEKPLAKVSRGTMPTSKLGGVAQGPIQTEIPIGPHKDITTQHECHGRMRTIYLKKSLDPHFMVGKCVVCKQMVYQHVGNSLTKGEKKI